MAFTGPVFFPPLGPANGSGGALNPKGWDRCTLGGQVVPGFCRITKGGIELKADKKPKAGADGANPTFHGIDPQGVDLEITTYSDEDRESLIAVVGPLIPQPGSKPKPVSIDHPSLRPIFITAVQITGASALIYEGPMKAKMTLRMLHWLPTTNASATGTPKGAPQRKPPNNRKGANPAPTAQPGVANPPAGLKPS